MKWVTRRFLAEYLFIIHNSLFINAVSASTSCSFCLTDLFTLKREFSQLKTPSSDSWIFIRECMYHLSECDVRSQKQPSGNTAFARHSLRVAGVKVWIMKSQVRNTSLLVQAITQMCWLGSGFLYVALNFLKILGFFLSAKKHASQIKIVKFQLLFCENLNAKLQQYSFDHPIIKTKNSKSGSIQM